MRILATDPVPPVAQAEFATLGDIRVLGEAPGDLAEAELLIVRGTKVDEAMLEAAPQLRIIARTGAGYDGVDVAAASARGIPVLYAPVAGTVPVAEGTMALMLAASKRLSELNALVRRGEWDRRYEVEASDLRDATLGVVGFGAIGQEVARLARGFGMQVIASDPFFSPAEDLLDVPALSLPELVAASDVVTLHCALSEGTRGIVDRALLAQFRRGAIFVNVARGPIVESDDVLLEALESGQLSAVALDVLVDEPPAPGHPLLSHPRAICTPHSVGLTARWSANVFSALAVGVNDVLGGRLPQHIVNPEVLTAASAAGPTPG